MATVLQASDIMNFEMVPSRPSAPDKISIKLANLLPIYRHPSTGTIRTDQFLTPYMRVTNVVWQTNNDVELHSCDSPENVNINFLLEGCMDTQFAGITHELNMRPKQHNIVYSPEGKDLSRIARNQTMNMFHISLNKDYFISSIGTDDKWSDRMSNEIYQNKPISGRKQNIESTPRMMQLIDGIQNCNATGPMRNLLIQSRLLELLALQMDQFRTPANLPQNLRPDEAQKLHNLKSYLDANFLSELSLTQLSRVCLLNEFKVKKGFKLLFGTTVFGYLRKLRMEYAANLLRDTSLSMDEVAGILGYEHTHHFSVAYRKWWRSQVA